MNTTKSMPTVLLIPGHWLGAWAWDEVRTELDERGVASVAMTLPGLDPDDPDRASRTVEDQVAALRTEIARQGDRPVILVAHSGANIPVSVVLDRHPESVARVVWVDSGPVADGVAFAADFPAELADLPLPPFDELGEQASLEGLSVEQRERFRARAVAEPASVLRQRVHLTNEARHRVATTLVCCSISGAQVQELAAAGHPMFAEVARLDDVIVVDLPTGHWPMWSRPRDLAALIDQTVRAS